MAASLESHYVLGFIFDKNYKNVIIQTKTHPHFLAGMKNGLGGKIEPSETPIQAIVREVKEEGGILIPEWQWQEVGQIKDREFDIIVFATAIEDLSTVIAQEDEPIEIMDVSAAIKHPKMAPHADECLETIMARFALSA